MFSRFQPSPKNFDRRTSLFHRGGENKNKSSGGSEIPIISEQKKTIVILITSATHYQHLNAQTYSTEIVQVCVRAYSLFPSFLTPSTIKRPFFIQKTKFTTPQGISEQNLQAHHSRMHKFPIERNEVKNWAVRTQTEN